MIGALLGVWWLVWSVRRAVRDVRRHLLMTRLNGCVDRGEAAEARRLTLLLGDDLA